jgi:hypothetical protein
MNDGKVNSFYSCEVNRKGQEIEETPPKKASPEKEMLFWRKEISYSK